MRDPMHIIKAQEYQIVYDDASAAHRLQTAISGLQDTRIDPLLDKILNKFSSDDYIYQFDTIELDLGSMSPANYETELVFRIEEALTAYLSATIYEHGKLRDGTSINTEFNLLVHFEHFLNKGHFKWNSHPNSNTSALLAELIKTKPKELRDLLKQTGKRSQTRKRMIFQFTDDELDNIVRLVAKEDGEYMIEYKDNVLEYQQKESVVNSSFSSVKSVVWEIVLGYLFADNRSYYDKRSFLRHLIQKMASKYNLDFTQLLKTLSDVAQSNPQLSNKKGEFSKLISDLTPNVISSELPPAAQRDDGDNSAWLTEVAYYLEHGVFRPEYSSMSKSRFNDEFIQKLRAPDQKLKKQLDLWLIDVSKNKRLLEIVEPRSLNVIVETSDLPAIKAAMDFLQRLEGGKASYTDDSRYFINKVVSARGELIIKLPMSPNYSEKKHLHRLLRNMLVMSNQNEDSIIQFLMEAKPVLSERYQQIVSGFLMTFYQNMGQVVLENISSEIRDYTLSNPMRFWHSWLHEKMPEWTQATKLAPDNIMRYVSKNFRKTMAPQALQFLVSEGLDTPKIEEIGIRQKLDRELNEKRQNEVFYLFEHGKLPWWIEPRPFWNNFNEEYGRLWDSPDERARLVGYVRKQTADISYVRFLEEPHFDSLLLEIGGAKGHEKVLFLNSIRQFIYNYLVPLGRVPLPHYLRFKESILSRVLSEGGNSWNDLVKYVKRWEWNAIIESRQSLTSAFKEFLGSTIATLSQTEAKRLLEEWRNELPEYQSAIMMPPGKEGSLKEFLIPLVSNPSQLEDTSRILGELQKMILARPASFDRLLHSDVLRKSLVEELPKEEISGLIQIKLASGQKESFQQALRHLSRYKGFMSHREYTKTMALFSERVLLQISLGGMHSWSIKEWGRLLYHTVNVTMGRSKHKNVLFRINDKISLDRGKYQNRNLRFIAQLNELVDETSEKVLVQTKNLFQEMVSKPESPTNRVVDLPARQFELIYKGMDSMQRGLHLKAMAYLDKFKSYISTRELKEIKELITKILNSQLNRSSLRNWRIENWGALLFHSANEVLGTEKSLKLHFKIEKEKVSKTPGETSEVKSIQAVIRSLADTNSEKKRKTLKRLFDSSIEQLEVRTRLDEAKRIKQEGKSIEDKLHPSQLEYYLSAISHLNSYKPYISQQEYGSMRNLFSKFLLLKLDNDNLGSWGMKDWGHLLFHSMNEVLGTEKNEEIRSRIHEQLNIVTEIEINESQQLVDELTSLANEIPKLTSQEPEDEKPYKKLGEPVERAFIDPIFINNAGLIILAPYLGMLFERCGLMESSRFKDEASKYKAVQLLSYAATGEVVREEHDLVINKVLCGLNLMAPMDRPGEVSASEMETVDGLLTAVTQQWTPLRETSINSLRETFLQRPGKLAEEENFYLKVEQRSYDMLLDRIPWNISKIKLSWMEKILEVEWKT